MKKCNGWLLVLALAGFAPVALAKGTCREDKECTLVPTKEGCYPCANNDRNNVEAVNQAAAQALMKPREETCKAEIQKMGQSGPASQADPMACKLNYATCNNGVCVGVHLEKADFEAKMKAMFEEMKKQMPPPQSRD